MKKEKIITLFFTLIMVVAFALAAATFIENRWGTAAAKALIYNTWWLEILWALGGIGLLVSIIQNRLYKPARLTVGLFHIAFLLIIVGAAVTRYCGFEARMSIREGQSSNMALSAEAFITVTADAKTVSYKTLFSEITPHRFDKSVTINEQKFKICATAFAKNAILRAVADNAGQPLLDLVVQDSIGMYPVLLRRGEAASVQGFTVGFETVSDIHFSLKNSELTVSSSTDFQITDMQRDSASIIRADSAVVVAPMQLFAFGGDENPETVLLLRQYLPNGTIEAVSGTPDMSDDDAVTLEISNGADVTTAVVSGRAGIAGRPVEAKIGRTTLYITYGSKEIMLPFSLRLRDFRIERYPGSDSPSSFTSDITLQDDAENVCRDVSIFMNNTLKYKGFRFYQSSFTSDERGTILSMNYDFWGTLITYIGYLLMAVGMLLSLFNPHSRFRVLLRQLNKPAACLLLCLLPVGTTVAQPSAAAKSCITEFERLCVSSSSGRIKPFATMAEETLLKIGKLTAYNGMSATETLLRMYFFADKWQNVPLLKVEPDVAAMLGIAGERATASDFFTEAGRYKLHSAVEAAYSRPPAMRTALDKHLINSDERLNVCMMVFNGALFKLFPSAVQASQNTAASVADIQWQAPEEAAMNGYSREDSLLTRNGLSLLREALDKTVANAASAVNPADIVRAFSRLQHKYAAHQLPSERKITLELLYNRLKLFKRLFPLYFAAGLLLLMTLLAGIFLQRTFSNGIISLFTGLIYLGFIAHTFGIALRWYISGHAPWSNGYESMVYVSWAAIVAGIIFGRRYKMILGIATFLAGATLLTAHLSWMNPEITPLVPVLKSWWLLFHVAVITASYGFLGLSALIGLLNMVLYVARNATNRTSTDAVIAQMTRINELSITVGLYLLTVGAFIGGVWANESWGRYWGWDPKETWALITILIYAFVAHLRLIPSMRGTFTFNSATIAAFGSVLMTYFGVNYLLSGMHSYGGGDNALRLWPFIAVAVAVAVLISLARRKNEL
ncbi:MAG: cytochrome c biogenesis protein CcsA [Bacteroidales bacterium]|jgi:cytochrome c-type biogenesis protein CcsB|nr:cytochrome c biogenesis protein CcsA [Bacteroidales bacterium]